MSSNSETFVLVPHEKFKALEEQLRQHHTAPPKTPTPPPSPEEKEVDKSDQEESPAETSADKIEVEEPPPRGARLSEETKDMVKSKSLPKRAFKKFLQAVSAVSTQKPDFDNLEALMIVGVNYMIICVNTCSQ